MSAVFPGQLRVQNIGTAAFMLMIVLSRIGRRIEAREAANFALSTDRPFP